MALSIFGQGFDIFIFHLEHATMATEMLTKTMTKMEMPIAVKTTTKMVKVPLDEEAQRKLGQDLAYLMVQIEHVRDELKKTVTVQREHITGLKDLARQHAKALNHGWEESLQTVEMHHNFNDETVKTFYLGKCIDERAMTEDEKQLDLEMCLQVGMTLKVTPDKGLKPVG